MIRPTILLSLLLAASLASSSALGQGSAGGYGQGGRSGTAGRADEDGGDPGEREIPRPEDGPGFQTRSAIVSPGDGVEYKFVVKAGETLLASATSEAFDPALSILDPAGKKVAENDEREEGDQSPFLAYRFPADGTYLLRVGSFRSAAGGKFEVKFRTLVAREAKVGAATTIELPPIEPDSDGGAFVRIAARKDQTYDVRLRSFTDRGQPGAPGTGALVGPTGVVRNDLAFIEAPVNRPIFRASRDGDYYLRVEPYGARRLEVEVRPVATTVLGRTGESSVDLAADEVRVVEFPVVRGGIVRTTVSGAGLQYRLVTDVPSVPERPGAEAGYGRTRGWTYFYPDRENANDVIRIFRQNGTARVALVNGNRPGRTTLRNVEDLPEWKDGATAPTLKIGESQFLRYNSVPGDLARISAKSPTFQARLDLWNIDGVVVNTLVDRKRKIAEDDLYFPVGGYYVVRLTSDGFGGSGVATLTKGAIPSVPYALGAVTRATLGEGTYGLYEIELQAGQRYALTLSDPGRNTRVDLIDDQGRFLNSPTVTFENVTVYYFVAERPGKHRLWLRGDGARTFRFERFVAPSLGPTPGGG